MTQTRCALIWLLFCLPFSAAAQNAFQLDQTNDTQLTFSYQWHDAAEQSHQLQFQVDKRTFLQPLKRYRSFNRERSQRELAHQLNRYIKQQQWRGIQARLTPRQQSLELITANARQAAQQRQLNDYKKRLQQYYQDRWEDYLTANYYRQLQLPPAEQGIIPDHPAIAQAVAEPLQPLIHAMGEQLGNNTQRNYINYVAGFIQAIPYNDLTGHLDSRGDGFVPPNQLLYYNQGDCDSKVTLMVALMRGIIKNVKMAIIYLPNHAIFGIATNKSPSDDTVEDDGISYVLVDVAGPAALPLGQISDRVRFQIKTEQYTVLPVN